LPSTNTAHSSECLPYRSITLETFKNGTGEGILEGKRTGVYRERWCSQGKGETVLLRKGHLRHFIKGNDGIKILYRGAGRGYGGGGRICLTL